MPFPYCRPGGHLCTPENPCALPVAINGVVTPRDVLCERSAARRSRTLRIRCKGEPARGNLLPSIADYSDCEISAVAEDGTEVRLDLVDRFEIVGEPGKPVTATLTFVGIELDVDARSAEPAPAADDSEPSVGDEPVPRG